MKVMYSQALPECGRQCRCSQVGVPTCPVAALPIVRKERYNQVFLATYYLRALSTLGGATKYTLLPPDRLSMP
jgi:hypothetical protein